MKYLITVFILSFQSLILAQSSDSIFIAQKVDSLIGISTKLWRAGRNEEALPAIYQAIEISQKKWGEYNIQVASALHRLASIYVNLNQNDTAEILYLKAIKLRDTLLGGAHIDIARSLNNLANLYKAKGAFEKSEGAFLRAKNIQEKVIGKEHQEYAMTLNNLGVLYHEAGYFNKAEENYLAAKDIRLKVLGGNHPLYATSLSLLGKLYLDKGDFSKSEPFLLEAKKIRDKVLSKSDIDFVQSLSYLAQLFGDKGDLITAEAHYLEAIEIIKETRGEHNLDYATLINNLGRLYLDQGELSKAEPLLLDALQIKYRIVGEEHLTNTTTLSNLGLLYSYLGDYKKSEKYYLIAKHIKEKYNKLKDSKYASILSDLGMLYFSKNEVGRAEKYLTEAKNIQLEILGESHPDYIGTLNNLGMVYSSIKKFSESESILLQAKNTMEVKQGKNNPSYAKILNNIALLYGETGRLPEMEQYLLEAKSIRENILGKHHRSYALTLGELGQYYYAIGNNQLAVNYYREMLEKDRNLLERTSTYTSESQLTAYMIKFETEIQQYYTFTYKNQSNESAQICFDNILFLKGFLEENSCFLTRAVAKSDTIVRELYHKWKEINRQIIAECSKSNNVQKKIDILSDSALIYEKELTLQLGKLGGRLKAPKSKDIAMALPPNSAAVEFIHFQFFNPKPTDSVLYAALVLLPGDSLPHFIPLCEEKQLLALLHRPGYSDESIAKDFYGNSPEAARLLWAPIQPLLQNATTIYYSPSGLLHRINPAALIDEQGRLLAGARTWVRLGSTRELVTRSLADRSFASEATPDTKFIPEAHLFGGIQYDMDSIAYTKANAEIAGNSSDYSKDGNFRYIVENGSRSGDDSTWESLPGSAKEADEIGRLLQKSGFQTFVWKGYAAGEERFKKIGAANQSSPRILHIATHGFAYPDPKSSNSPALSGDQPVYKLQEDPMLRSGLVLAGSNFYWKNKRPLAGREDGVLVSYEVRDLNLHDTELAVLSACQTGLGDVVGTEGVYGLQRAFRIAGVKFLIVSLWRVPDEKTRELMRLFYQNWTEKKQNLRQAFSNAQLTMQQNDPNPYNWAGFILIE